MRTVDKSILLRSTIGCETPIEVIPLFEFDALFDNLEKINIPAITTKNKTVNPAIIYIKVCDLLFGFVEGLLLEGKDVDLF